MATDRLNHSSHLAWRDSLDRVRCCHSADW